MATATCLVREEIGFFHGCRELIGTSPQLLGAIRKAGIVAPTDSTVLILGETGTGKELIANYIHASGPRRSHPLVKVNCAAIPPGLLESELFGHERGAFTGALTQRIGRFEAAHRGAIFLDEIGDIPLELQPKLLRILQEQEFERLGSPCTIRVDTRVIAATHRNLRQMMDEGKLRADLFYRLNVFPIRVPPLRERREDIAPLAQHFVRIFSQRMNRQVELIPPAVMSILINYPWNGNVRELENFIERSVILSQGRVLEAPLADLEETADTPVTLREAERAHIVRTLKETNGILTRAAKQLRVPRSTLTGKMRRLGIPTPMERQTLENTGAGVPPATGGPGREESRAGRQAV